MAKLELGNLLPYENSTGKYLEVMGVTAVDIVVIGSGGKTATFPLATCPDIVAGDFIYLNEESEILNVEKLNKTLEKAKASGQQTNSYKGCKTALAVEHRTA